MLKGEIMNIKEQTIQLIDNLKATCQVYGLGNDGNEYKIITQVFLFKFLNDKFGVEVKKISERLRNASKWEEEYRKMTEDERLDLFDQLSPDIPRLNPEHLISNLWNQQSKGDFDVIFDSTMTDIADKNKEIFSTETTEKTKIALFEKITTNVTDDAQRAPFARALVDKLINFSFDEAFNEHYDFFAAIFEYLIKDYNTAGGGKYAEYYTPHAIATIMARLLVGENKDLHNIECYDPSAGTGTLLMALSHQIGEDRCTIFSQDISQRSNKMLKLNLILNGLVSSLDHAIQGDTLVSPYHKSDDGKELRQFDYVVSNPPFKMDFSENKAKLDQMPVRFWGGVPKIPAKKKESMIVAPETFAKKIKPKLEIKIAPKLNQATPERELLFSKDTDRGFGRSGLYIEENGNTKPFGQKAGKEEIKNSIESIVKLIENYRKYVIDYNDNYGSRIIEIILYTFTSPFIQDIRFKLESDSEKLDVPQFLFIGGTAGSGKSNLLQILQKMLGLSKSKPILYNNIILTGRTKKADMITQIQL